MTGTDGKTTGHSWRDGNGFRLAGKDATTFRYKAFVVVFPARTGQFKQALTFCEAAFHIRVGINENVQMVKGTHQGNGLGTEHAITKHVAGHVANTDRRDLILLNVDALLAEVTLDRHPATPGRDAHLFVVVTGTAARGERITEPEAIISGNAVGNIRKRCCTFVSSHHQVAVTVVVHHHGIRMHDITIHQIIGHIEQTADKRLVAADRLLKNPLPTAADRQMFRHKAALGTHRHDQGIFHLLSLHQPENLGAIILYPVRPAQTTPGHFTAAQMHPFNHW